MPATPSSLAETAASLWSSLDISASMIMLLLHYSWSLHTSRRFFLFSFSLRNFSISKFSRLTVALFRLITFLLRLFMSSWKWVLQIFSVSQGTVEGNPCQYLGVGALVQELHVLAVYDGLLLTGLAAGAGLHLHVRQWSKWEGAGRSEPGRLGREGGRGRGGARAVSTLPVATPGAPLCAPLHVDPGQQVVLADDLEVVPQWGGAGGLAASGDGRSPHFCLTGRQAASRFIICIWECRPTVLLWTHICQL